jgi:sec-independent protein translocase protein TatA
MSLFAILGLNMEMAIVLLVALLLFGNRLPSVMRSLGQSVTEFKKGMEGHGDEPGESVRGSETTKKIDDVRANQSVVEASGGTAEAATKKTDDLHANG